MIEELANVGLEARFFLDAPQGQSWGQQGVLEVHGTRARRGEEMCAVVPLNGLRVDQAGIAVAWRLCTRSPATQPRAIRWSWR